MNALQWSLLVCGVVAAVAGYQLLRIRHRVEAKQVEIASAAVDKEIAAYDPLREAFKPLEAREAQRQAAAAERVPIFRLPLSGQLEAAAELRRAYENNQRVRMHEIGKRDPIDFEI